MSSKLVEEEDYWNTSDTKGFDFDGDKSLHLTPGDKKGDRFLFTDDEISECNYEITKSELPLSLIISEANLRMILDEQSTQDLPIPKNVTPEEEVRILRRQLLDKIHAPPSSVTINRFLLGKSCSLEQYKSLSSKEELLDEAITSGNGDAILYVVLFLVKTLKRNHLHRIFQTRPEAVNHYINYLSIRLKISEATDLLTMLGRDHDAAMLQFKLAIRSTSSQEARKQKLKQIYSNFFAQPGSNPFYSEMVAHYINLLEFQQSERSKGKSSGATESLNDASVLKTLYHVCSGHRGWGSSDGSLSPGTSKTVTLMTPQHFVDTYQISDAHFEWIALNERAKSQAWLDIETLFEKKSWKNLKTKTFTIHIPLEQTILHLHSLNAPPAVLNQFLAHIDDPHRRLAISRRVKAVRSEIDTLVALKDRGELEALKERLDVKTEEYFHAENALKLLNSKWKTDGIKLIRS